MVVVTIGKTAFGAANLGSLLHRTAASVSTDCTLDKRSLRLQVLPWLMLDVDADKGQLRLPKPPMSHLTSALNRLHKQ